MASGKLIPINLAENTPVTSDIPKLPGVIENNKEMEFIEEIKRDLDISIFTDIILKIRIKINAFDIN